MAKDAAGYCRISEDPEGREIGIDRQRQDNHTIAKREGSTLAHSHSTDTLSCLFHDR